MSPFGIFTIVLIILYIVYYAVLISRDLYSKKNTVKSEEEEFDVSSLRGEEMAVDVEESENGFSLNPSQTDARTIGTTGSAFSKETIRNEEVISGGTASSGVVPDGAELPIPCIPPSDSVPTKPSESVSSSGGGTSATQKKIDKVQEEMDEIDPIGNLTMSKEFFRDLLLQANKEGSLFVQKKQVSAV